MTVAAYGEGPLREACAARGIPFVPLRHVRRDISFSRDLVGLVELVRLFRRIRPDIVHLNSSKAGVLGRIAGTLARVPVIVFTAHGWAFKATSGLRARLYLWGDRVVRPRTTMTICVSDTDRREGIAARTCSADRSTVITNAVDVDAALPHTPGGGERVEIVSVARLTAQKDFPGLIAAATQLAPGTAHIRILGDGPQRPELETQIARHNLDDTVELVGEVADVRPYLATADIFVLSTHSEGMPIAVLEAMAANLPVVTTNVSGLHEVVLHEQTGLLTAADDPHALAEALTRLIDDPNLRRRLGDNGRRRAEEHFSLAPGAAPTSTSTTTSSPRRSPHSRRPDTARGPGCHPGRDRAARSLRAPAFSLSARLGINLGYFVAAVALAHLFTHRARRGGVHHRHGAGRLRCERVGIDDATSVFAARRRAPPGAARRRPPHRRPVVGDDRRDDVRPAAGAPAAPPQRRPRRRPPAASPRRAWPRRSPSAATGS